MKRELFTEICDKYRDKNQKLWYVKFVKSATGCGLKRAKCEIADECFYDPILDPYDLLCEEEKEHVAKYRRKKGEYNEQD